MDRSRENVTMGEVLCLSVPIEGNITPKGNS